MVCRARERRNGPLFAFIAGAFIAGAFLRRAFPSTPSTLAWLPGVAILVLDPGALPLVAWLVLKKQSSS